jgi:hypothetical protein
MAAERSSCSGGDNNSNSSRSSQASKNCKLWDNFTCICCGYHHEEGIALAHHQLRAVRSFDLNNHARNLSLAPCFIPADHYLPIKEISALLSWGYLTAYRKATTRISLRPGNVHKTVLPRLTGYFIAAVPTEEIWV